jgi:hypothetical protein
MPVSKIIFEFFTTLNEKPDADPINIPLLDSGDVNELNENINMKISKEEILKCIKKFKSIVSRIPVNYSISDYLLPLITFFCEQE